MTKLFLVVLNMSIAASYVAVAVLIARLLLKRAPKIFSYILWLAVAVRLTIPVSLTSDFSLLGIMQPQSTANHGFMTFVPEATALMKNPTIDMGIEKASSVISSALPAVTKVNSANPLQVILSLGAMVWLAGAAVMLLYSIAAYVRTLARIRTATLIRDHIYETDQTDTAFVCGFIKPKIIVPTGLTRQEMSYIVMHEQVHIQRRDYWIKPFAYLLLVIHWFNPIMWLSYAQMNRDMEMSCDERVVSKLGSSSKGGYATTLLSFSVDHKGFLRDSPLAFGEHHTKARIKNVLAYRKLPVWAAACILVVIAAVIAGCATNPRPLKVSPPAVQQQTYKGYDLDKLLDNKTLYVGNHIKVGGLIGGMPRPLGLDMNGLELQTSVEPYGVTYNYLANDVFTGADVNSNIFNNNAVMLLSLIDNVGSITFAFTELAPVEQHTSITYTREQVSQMLGEDVRTYAEDEEGLKRLIDQLMQ